MAKHMVAVSTNLPAVAEFGIDPANTFAFWDWVGGRYSVTSAVGVLPLALQYGYPVVRAFLDGAHDMDTHFGAAPIRDNLPILLALFSVWNSTFLARPAVAILPYSQALQRFAAHIQQVRRGGRPAVQPPRYACRGGEEGPPAGRHAPAAWDLVGGDCWPGICGGCTGGITSHFQHPHAPHAATCRPGVHGVAGQGRRTEQSAAAVHGW